MFGWRRRLASVVSGAMPTLVVGMFSREFTCSRKREHGTRHFFNGPPSREPHAKKIVAFFGTERRSPPLGFPGRIGQNRIRGSSTGTVPIFAWRGSLPAISAMSPPGTDRRLVWGLCPFGAAEGDSPHVLPIAPTPLSVVADKSVPFCETLRVLIERAVLLAAALLVLRTWFFDGFPVGCQVSGGSMAEALLGSPLRDVVCGDCGFRFSCEADSQRLDRRVACPNCGYADNPLAGHIRLGGDRVAIVPSAFAAPPATLGGDRISPTGGGLSVVRQAGGGPARRVDRNPQRRRLRRRPHPAENARAAAGDGRPRVRRQLSPSGWHWRLASAAR